MLLPPLAPHWPRPSSESITRTRLTPAAPLSKGEYTQVLEKALQRETEDRGSQWPKALKALGQPDLPDLPGVRRAWWGDGQWRHEPGQSVVQLCLLCELTVRRGRRGRDAL